MCIHVRMPQQFIETVLELNGLSFKSKGLPIHPLTKMMKSQQFWRGFFAHFIYFSFTIAPK